MHPNNFISRALIIFTFILSGFGTVYSQVPPPTVITFGPGGSQSWTVPDCVTDVVFTIAGGAGAGNAFGLSGGSGAVITVSMNVNPGDVFQFNAGGAGTNPAGGTNGGGSGQFSNIPGYDSGGGGGASVLSFGGAPIAVAGGGGGAGGGDDAGAGGGGGCVTGASVPGGYGTAGAGGSQTAGGLGGVPFAGGGQPGWNGSFGQGGAGGDDNNVSQSPGGGGGGGYYGGGGGGSDDVSFSTFVGGSGGGGGSSLVPAGAGCTSGSNAGAGYITVTFVGGLQAIASNTGAYCVGETIQLNGLGGVDYAWTGPNGFISNLQNPTIPTVSNADTTYSGTYQLIVSDPNCPDTDTSTTVVSVNAVPTVDSTMDQTLCHGDITQQIDFTGILANGVTYDWTNDNVNTGLPATGSGTIAPFTGSALTVPEISTIIVTPNTASCAGIPDTFMITVLPTPILNVSSDTTICQNGTGVLVATASGGGGGPYTYYWDFTPSSASTQIVNPTVNSTYSVYAENSFGCASVAEMINVTVLPPLTGSITGWDTVCPTYSTDITADVMGGLGQPYDFLWSSGQTQNGPDFHTITVDPSVTTTYTVTVRDQCESTPLVMSTNIRVAPLPVPAYTVLDPEQCEPAVFHIVNTTDPTMSLYNYWLVDGSDQYINQDTIETSELYAGLYDIQMIITSFEGCVDSLTFDDALEVKPKPVADFRHSPNPVLMFNTDVLFTNYSWNGYTYQWSFEDGYPSTSTQTNVQVQFPDGETGAYDIQLITTSELGCVDTMQYELVVFPEVLIYAPNTFTPDGDEFNQGWQVFMEGIDVYDFELLIFNRWGQTIWESNDILVPWDGTFNGKIVQEGTYQWVIRATDLLNDNKYVYNGHVNLIK
ncbi:MAG: gliding motility-associated-like protein [Crocinitomicaceae bacterium]|jgi:gliding motility-associated-like protein